MLTSKRFTNAVTKLYNAFHEGILESLDCKACAVGNICNNSLEWVGHYNVPESGYSIDELRTIERVFMFGTRKIIGRIENGDLKWMPQEVQSSKKDNKVFEALCAVVEYLCELEGIPNVMDYKALFETEADQPKHKLETVFV